MAVGRLDKVSACSAAGPYTQRGAAAQLSPEQQGPPLPEPLRVWPVWVCWQGLMMAGPASQPSLAAAMAAIEAFLSSMDGAGGQKSHELETSGCVLFAICQQLPANEDAAEILTTLFRGAAWVEETVFVKNNRPTALTTMEGWTRTRRR